MRSFFSRLLVLIAVLLMPLGMAPATAAVAHHAMTSEMKKGHCPDQAPARDMKGGFAECTMACAAALPAADLLSSESPMILGQPVLPAASERLSGLHPETATPPPKRS